MFFKCNVRIDGFARLVLIMLCIYSYYFLLFDRFLYNQLPAIVHHERFGHVLLLLVRTRAGRGRVATVVHKVVAARTTVFVARVCGNDFQ